MAAPRTWWNVTHPEHAVRLVVAARSGDEAQALAWIRWYGHPPRNELERLTRAACALENSEVPAESAS